jgi:nitrous oxidase accessory protein NosD
MGRFGVALVALAVVALIMPCVALVSEGQPAPGSGGLTAYSPHDRIYIENDAGLAVFPGQGTQEDPYRIENYRIDSAGGYSCIFLESTTKFVTISNCYLSNASIGIVYDYIGVGLGIELHDVSNVTITGCLIEDGDHSESDGIAIIGSKDISVVGCTITYYSIGIYESGSTRVSISECTISGSGSGVECRGGSSISIVDTTIIGASTGLNLWNGVTSLTADNCTFTNGDFAVYGSDISHIDILNSTIDGQIGFQIGTASNITLDGNTLTDAVNYVINVNGITDLGITNNTIEGARTASTSTAPIHLYNVNRVAISSNKVNDTNNGAIDGAMVDHAKIDHNTFSNITGTALLFQWDPCTNISISNNTFHNIGLCGVNFFLAGTNVLIENNNMIDIGDVAFNTWDVSHFLIRNNTIAGTANGAFFCGGGDNVTIVRNAFADFGGYRPFYTQQTENFYIYLNAFVGSGFGSDPPISGTGCYVDNGIFGNYWSWVATTDTNLDGIADSPVNVPASSTGSGYVTDHYPLVGWIAPPYDLAADASTGPVILTWEKPNYSICYDIEQYLLTRTGGGGTVQYYVGGDITSFTDTSVVVSTTYTYTVQALSVHDSPVSAPASVEVLDITPPELTISEPLEGSTVDIGPLEVSWSADDPDSGISECWYKIDGGDWSTAVSDTVTLDDVADGYHSVTVRAYNGADQYSEQTVSFYLDLEGPILEINAPAPDSILTTSSVELSVSVGDDGSSFAGLSYSFDGVDFTDAGLVTTVDLSPLADGVYTLWVKAVDVSGHETVESVAFTVDLLDPSLVIDGPSEDQVIATAPVVVEWSSSDSASGIAYYEVKVTGGEWQNNGLTRTFSFSAFDDGDWNVQIKAVDNAGRSTIRQVNFTKDLNGPEVSIVGPNNGQVLTSGDVNLEWTATDAGTSVAHVYYIVDGGTAVEIFSSPVSIDDLPAGSRTIIVRAVDASDHVTEKAVTIAVDLEAPDLSITDPDGSEVFNTTVTVHVTATDETGITISYSLDGAPYVVVGTYPAAAQFDLPAMTDGSHSLKVNATDEAMRSTIEEVNFDTDTVAPTFAIISPQDGSFNTTGSVTIVWSSSTPSDVDHYEYSFNGTIWTTVGGTSKTFELADGNYVVHIRAYDEAGNHAEDNVSFTVDTIVPTVTVQTPKGDDVPLTAGFSVIFADDVNTSSVRVLLDGEELALTWNGASASSSLPGLSPGTTYTIALTGRDMAGNEVSDTWSFTTTDKGTISGKVVDAQGRPIANATVTLDSGESAMTDNDGVFTITATMGQHNMTVTKDGYLISTSRVTIEGGSTTSLENISLNAAEPSGVDAVVIVAVVVIAAILAAGAFLMLRRRKV